MKASLEHLSENINQPIQLKEIVQARFDAPYHFHPEFETTLTHDIKITPKMSFGTGHHPTTYSMIELMQKIDFKAKTVYDFGTGTGILAILAEN